LPTAQNNTGCIAIVAMRVGPMGDPNRVHFGDR
jgi:hypothetical protein